MSRSLLTSRVGARAASTAGCRSCSSWSSSRWSSSSSALESSSTRKVNKQLLLYIFLVGFPNRYWILSRYVLTPILTDGAKVAVLSKIVFRSHYRKLLWHEMAASDMQTFSESSIQRSQPWKCCYWQVFLLFWGAAFSQLLPRAIFYCTQRR